MGIFLIVESYWFEIYLIIAVSFYIAKHIQLTQIAIVTIV